MCTNNLELQFNFLYFTVFQCVEQSALKRNVWRFLLIRKLVCKGWTLLDLANNNKWVI